MALISWIWGSQSGDYEEFYLLRYHAIQSGENKPTLRRKISSPPSRSKSTPSKILKRSREKIERGPARSHRVIAKLCLVPSSSPFYSSGILRRWRWRWYISPKLRVTFEGIRNVISLGKKLFILIYYSEVGITALMSIYLLFYVVWVWAMF
jgi:hypothetical protein